MWRQAWRPAWSFSERREARREKRNEAAKTTPERYACALPPPRARRPPEPSCCFLRRVGSLECLPAAWGSYAVWSAGMPPLAKLDEKGPMRRPSALLLVWLLPCAASASSPSTCVKCGKPGNWSATAVPVAHGRAYVRRGTISSTHGLKGTTHAKEQRPRLRRNGCRRETQLKRPRRNAPTTLGNRYGAMAPRRRRTLRRTSPRLTPHGLPSRHSEPQINVQPRNVGSRRSLATMNGAQLNGMLRPPTAPLFQTLMPPTLLSLTTPLLPMLPQSPGSTRRNLHSSTSQTREARH